MKKTIEQLIETAHKLRNSAKTQEAISTYLEAAEMARQAEQFLLAAEALHQAGVSARKAVQRPQSSRFRDALSYFKAADSLYQEAEVVRQRGDLYRDVAVMHEQAGLSSEALQYFQRAIEILSTDSEFSASLAITYDKLGLYYYKRNDLTTAASYMEKALKIFKSGTPHGFFQATTWLDYARVLAKGDHFAEALDWAEQSLSWYEADHDGETFDQRRCQLYGLLSVLYDLTGDQKKAKTFAKKYETLIKGIDPGVAAVLRQELKETFNDQV